MDKKELIRRLVRRKVVSEIMRIAKRKSVDAWLVGGVIRDAALGIRSRDYDIAVKEKGRDFAAVLARELKGHLFALDEVCGEYRITLSGRQAIDIKSISAIGRDLAERDFTMNAIALNLSEGMVLLDPHGGMKDIEYHLIKPVSETIFEADPLRLIRMFRLACVLGFTISKKALSLARQWSGTISKAAGERIRTELLLLLENHDSFSYMEQMDRIGLLPALFPEIEKGKQIPQRKYRSKNLKDHSLVCYDIMEQIIREKRYRVFQPYDHVMERFAERHAAMLKLAALLHDIGKVYAMHTDDQGGVHFWTHEKKGEIRLKQDYQRKFSFSKKEVELLSLLILHHMRAHLLSREETITTHARYRFIKDGKDAVPGILLLTYADSIASAGKGKEVKRVERAICLLMNYYENARKVKVRKRLVTGHDLMKHFQLRPGPLFKTILDAVEKERMDGGIKTKQDALDFVKELLPTFKK